MANKPIPTLPKIDAGTFGQQKGNVKPVSGKPVGGPTPRPAPMNKK